MSFAITESQYLAILNRLMALEEQMNSTTTALNQLVTLDQVQQVLVVTQTDVDELRTTVDALEERVVAIEQEPYAP